MFQRRLWQGHDVKVLLQVSGRGTEAHSGMV